MSSDVVISIFGKASDPERMFEVAEAAASEGMFGWSEEIDRDDFPGAFEDAERQKEPLILTRSDTNQFFEGLTAACRRAGLSYVVDYGPTGEDGYTNGFSWSPGMEKEFHYLLDGTRIALDLDAVKAAAANGMEAVNELIALYENGNKVGALELEAGFIDAWNAYAEDAPSP